MPDFRARAICREYDPEVFWPVATPGSDAFELQAADARSICRRCPVQQACLLASLDTPAPKDLWGIFGGADPIQRAELRRLLADREAQPGLPVPALASWAPGRAVPTSGPPPFGPISGVSPPNGGEAFSPPGHHRVASGRQRDRISYPVTVDTVIR